MKIAMLREQKGFTLIEVVTAILIVSITIVIMLMVQSAAWKGSGTANRQRLAATLLEEQVNKLKRDVVKTGSLPTVGVPLSGLSKKGVSISYAVENAIRQQDGATIANARKIQLKANWQAGNRADSATVATYIAKDY